MPKKYFEEFKGKAVRRCEQGESTKSLSQELHIAQSTMYCCIRENCCIETSVRRYTPAEFNKLICSLQMLEHGFVIVQQTGLIAKNSLQERLALLKEIH